MTTTPQPGTDPLETAIEAADWAYDGAFLARIDDRAEHQKALTAAVRAAAPIIAAQAERDALERAAAELRTLAAQLGAGWDLEPDPDVTYIAYGQAFKEAARRINEAVERLNERAETTDAT